MPEEKLSQSFRLDGGQLHDVQIGGIAGKDLNVTQNQQIDTSKFSVPLTQTDVVKLITQLEELFCSSGLPDAQKAKAIKHLESAKEEAQEEKPDKEFTAKNLQRATKVLKEAGATVDAGTSLWQKVKPILEIVSPWLGKAVGFFI